MPYRKSGQAISNQILQWKDDKGEINPENRESIQASVKFYGNIAHDLANVLDECSADFNKTDVFNALLAFGLAEILDRNKTTGRKALECVKGVFTLYPKSSRPEEQAKANIGEEQTDKLAGAIREQYVDKIKTRQITMQSNTLNEVLASVDNEEDLKEMWQKAKAKTEKSVQSPNATDKQIRSRIDELRQKGKRKRKLIENWDLEHETP